MPYTNSLNSYISQKDLKFEEVQENIIAGAFHINHIETNNVKNNFGIPNKIRTLSKRKYRRDLLTNAMPDTSVHFARKILLIEDPVKDHQT